MLQVPEDLANYAEAKSLAPIFEDLMREVFSSPLPPSESHLRVQLMRFLQQRHTTLELDTLGLKRRPPMSELSSQRPDKTVSQSTASGAVSAPIISGASKPLPTDLPPNRLDRLLVDKETQTLVLKPPEQGGLKLEALLKAESEVETVRRELFLTIGEVEELQGLFKRFSSPTEAASAHQSQAKGGGNANLKSQQVGPSISVQQMAMAFEWLYNDNPAQLGLAHGYLEAVAQHDDYQRLSSTDWLRVASLIDETKFLTYAESIGFSLEAVSKIKQLCLETVTHRDPCFLFRKTIDVHHVMMILRKLGQQPSQKHVTAYLRRNVQVLGADVDPNPARRQTHPRIDFREFLLALKCCPTDHEARAQRLYKIPDEHLRAYREVFETYASRDSGYLSSAEIRSVLGALGIELPDGVTAALVRESLEDPVNLALMCQRPPYQPEWLDFIELLAVVRKYQQGAAAAEQ